MAKVRLYTGLYVCPTCTDEYECTRVFKRDLVCQRCGKRLIVSNGLKVWSRQWPTSRMLVKQKKRAGV
ncbi:MAG: hypothetical protein NTU69_11065 [Proteobacteria bacterium]|nr:hypothetical protein [Pseudomonadota bacterium]